MVCTALVNNSLLHLDFREHIGIKKSFFNSIFLAKLFIIQNRMWCWGILYSENDGSGNTVIKLSEPALVKSWSYSQCQKLLYLDPLPPFVNVDCKFFFSFLASNASHSFFSLKKHWVREKGQFWVSLSKSNVF